MRFDHITARVPQGVGDIFWCYQKLIPHTKKISFKIVVTSLDCNIQKRSGQIVASWPGVESVEFVQVAFKEHVKLYSTVYDLDKILAKKSKVIEIDYSLNTLLDDGNALELIDSHPVQYDVELPLDAITGMPKEYILFYVSGTTNSAAAVKNLKLWTHQQWADMIRKCIKKYNHPIYLTGAHFDLETMNAIKRMVPEVNLVVNPELSNLNWLLRNAKAFIGYQSGLGVIAENLAVKQLMIYFPKLPKMRDSWCKPERRKTHFRTVFFTDSVDFAMSQLAELI